MPVTIEIDAAKKTILTTFTGEIGDEDISFARKELGSRPNFDPTFSHIIDFQTVTAANISTQFLRNFANEESVFRRQARQIVVAPQPHIFALARMTQILMEAHRPNIQVLRSLDEAYATLGIKRAG
jgi:hypothetical protein